MWLWYERGDVLGQFHRPGSPTTIHALRCHVTMIVHTPGRGTWKPRVPMSGYFRARAHDHR